jgi:hypothetical protein
MAKGKKQTGDHKRMGRPPHAEPFCKATVVLLNRQIAYLDAIAATIRGKSGKVVQRAEFIRAMIDAVQSAEIDLSNSTSEAEIRTLLTNRFKSRQ